MRTNELKDAIKDYGRDIRLNLDSVLSEEGAPGLSKKQIWAIALSCAYATKSQPVIDAIQTDAASILAENEIDATKKAATIMAMNNIYYRFTHLLEDKEIGKMPARLRMSVIGKPGVEKIDFELLCLAVSALSGCGACINAHVSELKKSGVSQEGIQSSVRIAATINAAAQIFYIN